jgi:hypothetical protein
MDTKEQETLIHKAGRMLAAGLKGFFGSIEINVQDGRYVNSNVKQSLRPEKQEKEANP